MNSTRNDFEAVWKHTQFYIEHVGSAALRFRNEHLFPDCRLEGINLGTAGILLGLLNLRKRVCIEVQSEIDETLRSAGRYLSFDPCSKQSAGLYTGDTGVALSLATVGRHLNDPTLIQAAQRRFENAVNICEENDFFSGRAGIIFAAAALSDLLEDKSWVEQVAPLADSLASHLVNQQGIWGIPASGTLDGNTDLFLGAAHGSAGIALALERYGSSVQEERHLEAAAQIFQSLLDHGFDAKSELFKSSVSKNSGKLSPSHASWCHGSLGLLWCLAQVNIQTIKTDHHVICSMLERVIDARRYDNPTLCHGVSGQLETMQVLSTHSLGSKFTTEITAARHRLYETLNILKQPFDRLSCELWASEDPGMFTPDLWVGFLGVTSVLIKEELGFHQPILSAAWLRWISTNNVLS